ncbi:hypothetical protein MLD38_007188 [Melastoma candidum]|uniref:Uncharacterized protein n=1 Tax=Melastoma candidum TaxID=119954 RepID=A0ACB9RQA7_9MYRT|nr:hypothetical protein MLD38_007188 [Melastoma candidum]
MATTQTGAAYKPYPSGYTYPASGYPYAGGDYVYTASGYPYGGGYTFSTYPFNNYPFGYDSSGSCDCGVAVAPAPHAADLKDVFKWVPHWVWKMRDSTMNIWDFWGIQMLVIGSISFQIILTLLGGRRKYVSGLTGLMMRFVVACVYLFATEVVPFSLGRLTGLRITDPKVPNPFVELKALLAPLLLLQLGYTDNITAYATQDTQLGGRQVLNLTIVVLVVCSILVRCWSYSDFVILFIPMFLAGIVKYAEGVWALKFALGWNTGVTSEDIAEQRVPKFMQNLPKVKGLELLMKAFYRFDCLKPHLEDWIYLPSYVSQPELSLNGCSPKESFRIAEIELGFMYDALYTKSPVIYSKAGLMVRFFSFFWLLVTLFGFLSASRNLPPWYGIRAYKRFTLSVLVLAVLLELYQIMSLPFSDWAIVKIANHRNWPLSESLLKVLGSVSFQRWRKWSDTVDQFNLLDFSLRGCDWTKCINFLKYHGINVYLQRSWSHYRMGPVKVPPRLKERVIVELSKFDEVRKSRPFTQRGQWTLERFEATDLKGSIQKGFDKCIVVWHLATDMCYHSNDFVSSSELCSFSKLLSDYMVYLLALHPNMLSTITGNIVLGHSLKRINEFRKAQRDVNSGKELAQVILRTTEPRTTRSTSTKGTEALITSKWDVLGEARELASSLQRKTDPWTLIFSMWMEMLCYAAYNCQVTYHKEQLRRGGELITIVWLILSHTTDKLTHDE